VEGTRETMRMAAVEYGEAARRAAGDDRAMGERIDRLSAGWPRRYHSPGRLMNDDDPSRSNGPSRRRR